MLECKDARSTPSRDRKEELARQRGRANTGSVAGGKMALGTFEKVEHSQWRGDVA